MFVIMGLQGQTEHGWLKWRVQGATCDQGVTSFLWRQSWIWWFIKWTRWPLSCRTLWTMKRSSWNSQKSSGMIQHREMFAGFRRRPEASLQSMELKTGHEAQANGFQATQVWRVCLLSGGGRKGRNCRNIRRRFLNLFKWSVVGKPDQPTALCGVQDERFKAGQTGVGTASDQIGRHCCNWPRIIHRQAVGEVQYRRLKYCSNSSRCVSAAHQGNVLCNWRRKWEHEEHSVQRTCWRVTVHCAVY